MREWSIGIFQGRFPTKIGPVERIKNPILTKHDVTDVHADFVADPFLIRDQTGWKLFCEVWDTRAGRGKIALAVSDDGSNWTYQGVVLSEQFHLSYPYIFFWRNSYYMVPESYQSGSVRLYQAVDFPSEWRFTSTLLEGPFFADASVFRWRQHWWMLVETNPEFRADTLRLFHADDLIGPWYEHPKSPVVNKDPTKARPAGRVIQWKGRPIRFSQDCQVRYGLAVRAFEITVLTPFEYDERLIAPDPMLSPGVELWNSGGMHHVDLHWSPSEKLFTAAVDGWNTLEDDVTVK